VGNNNRTIQSLTVFWIQNFASPFYELNEVKLTTLDAANGNPTYPLFTGADTTSYIELPAEYGDSYGWPLTSDPNRKLLPNTTGDDLVAGNGNFITVTFNAPPTIDMGGISIEISFDSGCNGVTDQNATKVTLP
jgi:hypothetical protein